MIRSVLLAVALVALPAPALAEPDGVCGLEELSDPALATCPPYITYDEEGEAVSGTAAR